MHTSLRFFFFSLLKVSVLFFHCTIALCFTTTKNPPKNTKYCRYNEKNYLKVLKPPIFKFFFQPVWRHFCHRSQSVELNLPSLLPSAGCWGGGAVAGVEVGVSSAAGSDCCSSASSNSAADLTADAAQEGENRTKWTVLSVMHRRKNLKVENFGCVKWTSRLQRRGFSWPDGRFPSARSSWTASAGVASRETSSEVWFPSAAASSAGRDGSVCTGSECADQPGRERERKTSQLPGGRNKPTETDTAGDGGIKAVPISAGDIPVSATGGSSVTTGSSQTGTDSADSTSVSKTAALLAKRSGVGRSAEAFSSRRVDSGSASERGWGESRRIWRVHTAKQ